MNMDVNVNSRIPFLSCHNKRHSRNECKGSLMKLIQIHATKDCYFLLWYVIFLSASLEMITSQDECQTNFWHIPRRSSIFVDTRIFFLNIHATYFSTGCCYITPINLSNIPVVMATLNIYSYSWVELQKHCVYPRLSQQMTHLRVCRYPVAGCSLRNDVSGCLCSFC